jgi:hypothetical protein
MVLPDLRLPTPAGLRGRRSRAQSIEGLRIFGAEGPPGWRLQRPHGAMESRVLRGSRYQRFSGVQRRCSSRRSRPRVFGSAVLSVLFCGDANLPGVRGVENRRQRPSGLRCRRSRASDGDGLRVCGIRGPNEGSVTSRTFGSETFAVRGWRRQGSLDLRC